MKPELAFEPSPKIVSMAMCSSMYIIPPASADHGLLQVEFDFNELHVVAVDVIVNFVHCIHRWGKNPHHCRKVSRSLSRNSTA